MRVPEELKVIVVVTLTIAFLAAVAVFSLLELRKEAEPMPVNQVTFLLTWEDLASEANEACARMLTKPRLREAKPRSLPMMVHKLAQDDELTRAELSIPEPPRSLASRWQRLLHAFESAASQLYQIASSAAHHSRAYIRRAVANVERERIQVARALHIAHCTRP